LSPGERGLEFDSVLPKGQAAKGMAEPGQGTARSVWQAVPLGGLRKWQHWGVAACVSGENGEA